MIHFLSIEINLICTVVSSRPSPRVTLETLGGTVGGALPCQHDISLCGNMGRSVFACRAHHFFQNVECVVQMIGYSAPAYPVDTARRASLSNRLYYRAITICLPITTIAHRAGAQCEPCCPYIFKVSNCSCFWWQTISQSV